MRRRGNLKRRNVSYLRDAMKTVSDDLNFGVELGLVTHLLKVTTTAAAKIRTRRLDALRRRLDAFNDRGEADCALLSINPHAQAIAGRRERDHHGLAFRVSEAETSRNDALDCYFHDSDQGCRKKRLNRGIPKCSRMRFFKRLSRVWANACLSMCRLYGLIWSSTSFCIVVNSLSRIASCIALSSSRSMPVSDSSSLRESGWGADS